VFLVQVKHLTVVFFTTTLFLLRPAFIMKSTGTTDLIHSLLTFNTPQKKQQFVLKAFEIGDNVVFSAVTDSLFGMESEKRESLKGVIVKREFGIFTIKVDMYNIYVRGVTTRFFTIFPADILEFIQDTNVPAARIQALVRGFICRKHQRAAATQSELKATQSELKATQSELKATQSELKATQSELKAKWSESSPKINNTVVFSVIKDGVWNSSLDKIKPKWYMGKIVAHEYGMFSIEVDGHRCFQHVFPYEILVIIP
jgi:hypothetical protein